MNIKLCYIMGFAEDKRVFSACGWADEAFFALKSSRKTQIYRKRQRDESGIFVVCRHGQTIRPMTGQMNRIYDLRRIRRGRHLANCSKRLVCPWKACLPDFFWGDTKLECKSLIVIILRSWICKLGELAGIPDSTLDFQTENILSHFGNFLYL